MWNHHYSRYSLTYDIDIHFSYGHLSWHGKLGFRSCHFGMIFFLLCNYYLRDPKIGIHNSFNDISWLVDRNYDVFNILGHLLNQRKNYLRDDVLELDVLRLSSQNSTGNLYLKVNISKYQKVTTIRSKKCAKFTSDD